MRSNCCVADMRMQILAIAERSSGRLLRNILSGQVEDKLDISWWETRDNFPLSSAADDLDKSDLKSCGDLLTVLSLVAHVAGAGGPAVSILTGITAEAATARLAAPLGDAARLCEVVGILGG